MNRRLDELARRREALQCQAADERRSLEWQIVQLGRRTDPLRRAVRWAGTALLAWRLWRRWRRAC